MFPNRSISYLLLLLMLVAGGTVYAQVRPRAITDRPASASGNNNEVTLSVDDTSTSIYDSIVKVNTSIESKLNSVDGTLS